MEVHPFEPWLPKDARLLMLGTFPPSKRRWSMEFYYPNFQNDMWRIVGLCFYGDKNALIAPDGKHFDLPKIKATLLEHHIAIFDTALRIIRTKNTASDKDLQIVEPADLDGMLRALPQLTSVLAAGQLATKVFTDHYGITEKLKMGASVTFTFEGRELRLWRMPSSSRAYPMAVERKAEYYKEMFNTIV